MEVKNKSKQQITELLQNQGNLLGNLVVDEQKNIYISSLNGDIYRYDEENQELKSVWNTGGCPNGILFNNSQTLYVCDMAHQAILKLNLASEKGNKMKFETVVKDFDGKTLLGPNSFVVVPPNQSQNQHTLIFTDSGPLGESAIEKANGSLYQYFLETQEMVCLLKNCLAHPCGIAYFKPSDCIFVAETLKNRIIRLVPKLDGGGFYISLFHQFSGKLGPTALAVSQQQGLLFVGRYDFPSQKPQQTGIISILNIEGQVLNNLHVKAVQITGLSLYYEQDEDFQTYSETLYITDRSQLYKLEITPKILNISGV